MIDARVAFVGGINILDDDPARGMPPRFDYAVRVEGPLLAQIYPVVKRLWRLVAATQFRSRRPEARDLGPDRDAARQRSGRRCWCATACGTAAISRTPTSRPSPARARRS